MSKSQYIKGMQCPLALWYFKNRKDLIPEIDEAKQALFDSGHEVGNLAKQLYPEGREIEGKFYEISKFVNDTRTALAEGLSTLFEAAACTSQGLYSRIDILNKSTVAAGAWDLIEVKSSTSVKPYQLEDMAVQRHIFEQAGIPVDRCYLMHVNKSYVRQGPVDPAHLLVSEDVTDQVLARGETVAGNAERLLKVMTSGEEPEQPIGLQCHDPFDCDFIHHCWKHVPEYSVYTLFKGEKLQSLIGQNITRVQDIPETMDLTDKQRIDIQAYKKNESHIEPQMIQAFMEQLRYPLYFLDYETVGHAIPLFDRSSPFQQIPFQFSLHVQYEPGGPLEHKAFLYEGRDDPRPELIRTLIDVCGTTGSVLVYYQAFEATRNKEMAAAFPEYAPGLLAINERMLDLWVPFNSRYLYTPAMQSSASIKKVLPALVPSMRYDGLEIKEGESASRSYLACLTGKVPEAERKRLFRALHIYCHQDTLAMVKLLEVLEQYQPKTATPAEQLRLF